MKIGILTHHYIKNFGAFLQAYALQETVKQQFPKSEVYIINYINVKHNTINTAGWFRYYKDKETFTSWREKVKLTKTFSHEIKKHLNLTSLCLTASDINKLNFDTIIIGSDEVWNFNDKRSTANVKFSIGLDCKNIITYAPSVGKSDVKGYVPNYVKDGIKGITAFSTRDDLTYEFVKNLTGKEATRVLDPTFLWQIPKVENRYSSKPYILFYYCDKLPQEYFDKIKEYASKNNYAVYGAGECNKGFDEITVNLTPFEWVQMFRDAKFVFTGTFHGTVFSILNKKDFACYLTNESRIKKVNSLLNEFEIKDRIFNDNLNIEKFINNKIEYNNVQKIIDRKVEESLNYLQSNVK